MTLSIPRRKQRGIFKSIERPKGRGIKPQGDLNYDKYFFWIFQIFYENYDVNTPPFKAGMIYY